VESPGPCSEVVVAHAAGGVKRTHGWRVLYAPPPILVGGGPWAMAPPAHT
jgi:hypothetical protein